MHCSTSHDFNIGYNYSFRGNDYEDTHVKTCGLNESTGLESTQCKV